MPVLVETPTAEQEWLEISKLFDKRWNCPHALGAIDGKQATVRKTKKWWFNLLQ